MSRIILLDSGPLGLITDKTKGLARLDGLERGYLPLTSEALFQAAEFWAKSRRSGKPTAADSSPDGGVILCAQAAELMRLGHAAVIATTNVKHLEIFADARLWQEIR